MEPVPAIGPVVAVLGTYLHRRAFVKIEKRERSIGDFRISLLSVALATLEAAVSANSKQALIASHAEKACSSCEAEGNDQPSYVQF